jgi:hypothetical protein
MADLYAEALAELRALRTVQPEPEAAPEPEPRSASGCCTGDRRGYQCHQRTGNLPACEESTEANRLYIRDYFHRTGRTTRAARRRGTAA